MTVILPPEDVWTAPVFAGCHRLNGNGEMTGLEWVRESGMRTTPVALTNTHSVGVVRDALPADRLRRSEPDLPSPWGLPVVAETWDGVLNDLNGFHVRPERRHEAIAAAGGALGVARLGGVGEHTSGDLFLCFGTGNRGMIPAAPPSGGPTAFPLSMFGYTHITGLFDAVVEATEEAMLTAPTTEGRDGIVAHGLDGERVAAALSAARR